jgi:hypothetical protein
LRLVGFGFRLVAGLSARSAAHRQIYGGIIGTVTDPAGAAIVGATVTVTSIDKGTSQQTTNRNWQLHRHPPIPGNYKIRIEARVSKVTTLLVYKCRRTTTLTPARSSRLATSLIVRVTGEVPQLKTDRSDVAIEFNDRYMAELPLLNRNFNSQFISRNAKDRWLATPPPKTPRVHGRFSLMASILAARPSCWTTDNQDPILRIIVVVPTWTQFKDKVALQNYDAEFGKAVAGVITVQTKSGTNEIHGSGFYDYRGMVSKRGSLH